VLQALAFGSFLPDQLPVGADKLVTAKNVLPAPNGYRAVPDFAAVSSALPAAFLGGYSAISTDGTAYLLAGTASTLSRLSAGSWSSLLTGLTVTARWRFVQFGDFVIAVNGGATQEVDLDAGTASALTGAPTAIDVDVVGPHVVYAQPDGDILKVQWSAFEDHTGNTLGTDQAGDQPMLTGGEVMGIAGGEFGVILQRQRLVRMSLTGDSNAPFQFDEITPNFGCAAKGSIAKAGRTVFCLSDRGFIAIDDGQAVRPIGNEKFDTSFRAALGDEFERVYAVVDPQRTQVCWAIPGNLGQVWVYNWVLDRATVLELALDGVFAGFENSKTLEEVSAANPDLDAMTISLDDPRFKGGAPTLYVVQSGILGVLGGTTLLTASFETAQFPPFGARAAKGRAIWPDTDATAGITVTVKAGQRQGDTVTTRTATNLQDSGRVPLQFRGKFLNIGLTIANNDWSYANGVVVEADQGAMR
jgi:hypothetical protein